VIYDAIFFDGIWLILVLKNSVSHKNNEMIGLEKYSVRIINKTMDKI